MHTPEETKTLELGAEPYAVIRFPTKDGGGFDVDVQADGVRDSDELAVMLLLVVESVTGVDSDLYVQQVDVMRRAAGLGPLTVGAGR
jgi:hypothetical protein